MVVPTSPSPAPQPSRSVSNVELSQLSMEVPKITPAGVIDGTFTIDQLIRAIHSDVYYGLEDFCKVPDGYLHCKMEIGWQNFGSLGQAELRHMIGHPSGLLLNPYPPHLDTIELFARELRGDRELCENGDPLRPLFGAYLFGPPGCGKTHLLAAFALQLHEKLEKRLEGTFSGMRSLIQGYYKEYADAVEKGAEVNRGQVKRYSIDPDNLSQQDLEMLPGDKFTKQCDDLRARLKSFSHQPTDLLYMSFDSLCDIYGDETVKLRSIKALEHAPMVFIDDLYIPEDDPARLDIVKRVIENRLANGRIATFISSNVSPDQLVESQDIISRRLQSRCKELYVSLDFTGVPDWRTTVRARKNESILRSVQEGTDRQIEELKPKALEAGLGESWGVRQRHEPHP